MVGVGQLIEGLVVHLFKRHTRLAQRRFERPTPVGSFQRRAHGRPDDRDPRGERLLDEPHSFGQRRPPLFTRLAALQIPDRGEEFAHGR